MRWAECAQLPQGEYIGIYAQGAAVRETIVRECLQTPLIVDRSEWQTAWCHARQQTSKQCIWQMPGCTWP